MNSALNTRRGLVPFCFFRPVIRHLRAGSITEVVLVSVSSGQVHHHANRRRRIEKEKASRAQQNDELQERVPLAGYEELYEISHRAECSRGRPER